MCKNGGAESKKCGIIVIIFKPFSNISLVEIATKQNTLHLLQLEFSTGLIFHPSQLFQPTVNKFEMFSASKKPENALQMKNNMRPNAYTFKYAQKAMSITKFFDSRFQTILPNDVSLRRRSELFNQT